MDNHEKEPMFSAKNLKLLTEPFGINNPITVQVLGICSALAVTVKLKPAIVMALSVTIVTAVSNLVIACLKEIHPRQDQDNCTAGRDSYNGNPCRPVSESLCI